MHKFMITYVHDICFYDTYVLMHEFLGYFLKTGDLNSIPCVNMKTMKTNSFGLVKFGFMAHHPLWVI